jgi:hypothetical protein
MGISILDVLVCCPLYVISFAPGSTPHEPSPSICSPVQSAYKAVAPKMYHLFKGLHEYMTRKDEYSVVILGLDNVSSPPNRRWTVFISPSQSHPPAR